MKKSELLNDIEKLLRKVVREELEYYLKNNLKEQKYPSNFRDEDIPKVHPESLPRYRTGTPYSNLDGGTTLIPNHNLKGTTSPLDILNEMVRGEQFNMNDYL